MGNRTRAGDRMRGLSIVKTVMAERRIGQKDFWGPSRLPRHVKARAIAIKRLDKAGLNKAEISRAVRRSRSTVRYWLSENVSILHRSNLKQGCDHRSSGAAV